MALEDSKENQKLQILNTIALQLNGAVSLQKALDETLQRSIELMGLQTGWIWLFEPKANAVFLAASHNLPPALAQHPERLSGWCYCIDKYLANNLETASNISEITCSRLENVMEDSKGLKFHATIPLYNKEEKIGLLNILSEATGQLTEDQLQLLHMIGQMLSITISRTRIFENSKNTGALEERKRLALQLEKNLAPELERLILKIEALKINANKLSIPELDNLLQLGQKLQNYSKQTIGDLHQSSQQSSQKSTFQYPGAKLSNRELEVLQLLKAGQTNKAIAAELFISERTVKFHVSMLLQKLDARNRTEAVQVAMKRGILEL